MPSSIEQRPAKVHNQSSLARIAREFGMTEKQASHRLRARYRELVREEIAHTVATPGEIETELRELIAALPAPARG